MPGTEAPPADGTSGDVKVDVKLPETPKLVSMTQEALDSMIEARVARAKPKDYDELVALRDAKATADETAKTDLQKAVDGRKAAEAAGKTATDAAHSMLRRAAIMVEAASQGAASAEIVASLLVGDETVTVKADGTVVGAKDAVAKLLKDNLWMKKGASPDRSGSDGFSGGVPPVGLAEKIRLAEEKMNDQDATPLARREALNEARRLKLEQAKF